MRKNREEGAEIEASPDSPRASFARTDDSMGADDREVSASQQATPKKSFWKGLQRIKGAVRGSRGEVSATNSEKDAGEETVR